MAIGKTASSDIDHTAPPLHILTCLDVTATYFLRLLLEVISTAVVYYWCGIIFFPERIIMLVPTEFD